MKNIKKVLVHMYLPQHSEEERLDINGLYEKFYKRAVTKTNDNYVDNSRNPVMMIMNINHSVMDFQEGVLVKYGSLVHLIRGEEKTHIGFYVTVYTGFSNDTYRLTVLKSGKAFLEKEKHISKMIKKREKSDKKEAEKIRKKVRKNTERQLNGGKNKI